ncbi:MAG: DUF615 domain-containing protein [Proteobacteria bacterium]|nr:DUF615 domain-containing protein [Pseudomonadota bacterium]
MTQAKPSKSARKREQLALQELGEKLIALTDAELDSMSLEENLLTAVRDAVKLKSHGALRRQKQLIGKLMRRADAAPIRRGLEEIGASERQSKHVFLSAEHWRDRLIEGGSDELYAFETQTCHQDEELRSLLTELTITVNDRTEKSLRRQIFRHVHSILAGCM